MAKKKAVQTSARTGADYVVRAEHPRRPGQPLRVTTKDGRLLGVSGQTCTHLSADELASMIRNDYVELVAGVRRTRKGA